MVSQFLSYTRCVSTFLVTWTHTFLSLSLIALMAETGGVVTMAQGGMLWDAMHHRLALWDMQHVDHA